MQLDPQLPPIRAEERHITWLIVNMIAYATQLSMQYDQELNHNHGAVVLSSQDLQLCHVGMSDLAGTYVELTIFQTHQ